MSKFVLRQGDCLEVLRRLPSDKFDSVVTDPPYGLSFMGRKWDYDVPSQEIWAECLRVLKPGGHLLAFAGTRTQHRMAVRIEDAGFEIRDMIAWVYGSGFPKSLDVSKAIDKAAGAERKVIGSKIGLPGYSLNQCSSPGGVAMEGNIDGSLRNPQAECAITAPATDAAKQWQGWGTALKPALEPITVARKPFAETVAENVQQYGVGALNIDGCRVPTYENLNGGAYAAKGGRTESQSLHGGSGMNQPGKTTGREYAQPTGRWPANLIHDGSDEVLAAFPSAQGQQGATGKRKQGAVYGAVNDGKEGVAPRDDSGSAARFFYCAKASKRERGEDNTHPTVKPINLMRYLCRLVTPPGGVVMDPFMGSGSTGLAALAEGFRFIGIERDPNYFLIAQQRISQGNMP